MPQSEVVVADRAIEGPVSALESLAAALEAVDIGSGAADLSNERDRLVTAIRTYLVPRMEDPTRPATVVFAGPTGSGKSTLLNSLTGRDLTKTGALRPTTSEPVALVSEARGSDFAAVGGVPCEVVVGTAPILDAMVLIDTPDIDSTTTAHRRVAESLIDDADVVVFVTSALRYADDVAWQVLRRARSRGVEVVHVLNRVSGDVGGAVVDYGARLRAAGIDDDLVTIPEHHVAVDGQRIPSLAVRSLARRLVAIASSRDERLSSAASRVLGVTLRQTAEMAREISLRSEEADSLAADLTVELASRASSLDLSGASPPIVEAPPVPAGRMAMRRWRRRVRVSEERASAIERQVIDKLAGTVHADLRAWATETGAPSDLDMPDVARRALVKAEAWVRFVARMASGANVSQQRPLELVLLHTALAGVPVTMLEALAGSDGDDLVDRARRELETSVGHVYDHAALMMSDAHRRRVGALDPSDLESALGVLLARSSPVDA